MRSAVFRMLFMLLPVAAPVLAQTTGSKAVQVVAYWEPGDSHTYALEMGTEMSLKTGDSESFTSYRVLVEVLEYADGRYLIQWTYFDSVPPAGANAFERRVVEINEGLSVRYFTSDLGEFIGAANWEEIASRVNGALARILTEFAGEPDIETSAATIRQAFASKEQFERTAMEEIRLYHMLHGYSYLKDDPMIAEGEAASPFGGHPIRAKTTIELEQVDSENETAYLIYTRAFDQASLARAVFELVNGYLPEDELTPEQTAGLPRFDMQIKNQFIFHTGSGWLLEAYSARYAETEGETRTDSIYIKFLE